MRFLAGFTIYSCFANLLLINFNTNLEIVERYISLLLSISHGWLSIILCLLPFLFIIITHRLNNRLTILIDLILLSLCCYHL